MTSSRENTLSVSSFNLIWLAARQRGANGDALLNAVGITPRQLTDPDARIPIRQVQALWREAIAATADPHLDLKLGELIHPVAVGVLAYVMMHCPTLGRAFEKLCQYQDIACDGVRTSAQREGDFYRLSLEVTSPDIIYPEYTLNSELVMYLSAMRALTGHLIPLTEVTFSYVRPLDTREHERVFAPTRLVFDAPRTSLLLEARWLDTPILNANPALFPFFAQHADDLLRRLRQPSLTDRVKAEILRLLKGEEPTLAVVADSLAMGVRTLQNHLKEEGVTYQQLLDEVRRNLAVRHLRDPYLSTSDIAYLLGYSEPSVFYRSFKKWTGATPGEYRKLA